MTEYISEIKEMIEILAKNNKFDLIKGVYSLVNWKLGVREETQCELEKLRDIFYYLHGMIETMQLYNKELIK